MSILNDWGKVWNELKKKSCNKKKWYWDYLFYMCKWNLDRFFFGVEYEFKRIEKVYLEIRKLYCDLNVDEIIY